MGQSLAVISGWDWFKIMPHLTTIVISAIIIVAISLIYYFKIKRADPEEAPRGLVLVVELIIKAVENLVVDILGQRYKKRATPYVLYLLVYIITGNLLSVIGLESQFSSFTVTLSLGLVTFLGTFVLGFRFQKILFLKRYMNPLEIISQFAPLISISFRLFGNILGGTIIINLVYDLLGNTIWGQIPVIGAVDLLSGLVMPWLHMYFDLFDGIIQAFIFAILTMVYWKLEMEEPESRHRKRSDERTIEVQRRQPLSMRTKKPAVLAA